jgi:hypothetical protein
MNSTSRVKLLAALLGMIFLGSVVYLLFEGRSEEEADSKAKETLGKAVRTEKKTQNAGGEAYPRCPICGKELPASGECPFCLIKKQAESGGKLLDEPVPRLGRYLAWSMLAATAILGAVHVGLFMRQRRRFLGTEDEAKLKTKCPHCKRKVSFPGRLVGTFGNCPTCRNRLKFDPIAYEY